MKCQHQVELATFGTEQYATLISIAIIYKSIHYDGGGVIEYFIISIYLSMVTWS